MEMRVRNQSHQLKNKRQLRRPGFTLLELMVAIVVISILAAFLLPAIQSIVLTGREAAVRNEISQMETAIATFKQKFGIDPPSTITLYEAGGYSDGSVDPSWQKDSSDPQRLARSTAILKRMWPNIKLINNGLPSSMPLDTSANRDFNGDSDTNDVFVLTGAECLVFFLGGLQKDDALYGFSRNPIDPFETISTNRDGPFFEFVPSRLKPSPVLANAPAKVYFDPLSGQTNPYVYLSSYDGQGYSVSEVSPPANLVWFNPDGLPQIPRGYFQVMDAVDKTKSVAHKAKTFQIISPGKDFEYGVGGVYNTEAPNNGLTEDLNRNNILDYAPAPFEEDLNGNNAIDPFFLDFDNITNFSPGRLKP